MRVCARLSRAEATSSNAFVIFCVLLTERIRRFRSWTVAIYVTAAVSLTEKVLANFSISARSFSWSSSGNCFVSRISL